MQQRSMTALTIALAICLASDYASTAHAATAGGTVPVQHNFSFTLTTRDASGGAIKTTTVTGAAKPIAIGVNPLYEGGTLSGSNPMYEAITTTENPIFVPMNDASNNVLYTAIMTVVTVGGTPSATGTIRRELTADFLFEPTEKGGPYSGFSGRATFASTGQSYFETGGPLVWTIVDPLTLSGVPTLRTGAAERATTPIESLTIDAGSSFVTTVVPEPAALAASLGALGVIGRRRRSR